MAELWSAQGSARGAAPGEPAQHAPADAGSLEIPARIPAGYPVPPGPAAPRGGWLRSTPGLITVSGGLLAVLLAGAMVAVVLVAGAAGVGCMPFGCGVAAASDSSDKPARDRDSDDDDRSSDRDSEEEAKAPVTEPESNVKELGGLAKRTSIEETLALSAPPVWATPYLPEWETLAFNEGGINKYANTELGCVYTTSQNRGEIDSPSDRVATEKLLADWEGQMLAGWEGATILERGSIDMAVGLPGSSVSIEFLTLAVSYQLSGVDITSVHLARSMPATQGMLWAQVECRTATVDAGNSPFDSLTSQMAVMSGIN